jgi:hypothetical protein
MTLDQFRSSIPKGAFWMTGDLLRDFVDVLIADRARLAEGSGNELPSEKGRFFDVKPGANLTSFNGYAAVSGQIKFLKLYGAVTEAE